MNKMNRPFQLSSRRSDFAHQNFDLIEEPDFFTDEHLHEHFRNLEIDLEIDDYDHFDQPRVHEPSWGNSHRRCRRRRRIKSDAAAEASPSMADILGHDDSVATSLSSSSSSFLGSVREDDLSFSFLLGAGRDSISLASRRGVPALLSVGSRSRDEEDDNESFAKDFPFLNRDSLSLASQRGVPKSFFSEGEDDDCGGDDDASDHSHFFVSKNDGEEDYDEAASCIRGKSDTSLAEEKERDNGECDAADLHSLDDLLLSGWDSISETRTRSIAGGRCSGTSETSRTISPLISRRLSDMILEDGLLDRHSDGYDLFVSWPHKD